MKNIENLNKYGVVHAGSGRNLAEARAPAYLETAKGRIALLSGTTTLFPWGRAGDQRRDFLGRPGANMLRHIVEYTVDKATFENLQRIGAQLGMLHKPGVHRPLGHVSPPDTATTLHLTAAPPADAVAIIAYDANGKALLFATLPDTHDKLRDLVIDESGGHCGTPQPPNHSGVAGKVTFAYVDQFGRLSPQSKAISQ